MDITLTLKDIYKVCCPNCQKKILDMAASEGAKAAVRDSLLESLEDKKKTNDQ